MSERTVLVPVDRVARWLENFGGRHGAVRLTLEGVELLASAEDGTRARLRLPFAGDYAGAPDAASFTAAVVPPAAWGVLLVRKGGFAVARLEGAELVGSKTGRRHVQGRTKAGGQSQQRFARRRGNQARQAYEAAAEHAHRLLVGSSPAELGSPGPTPVELLVCGGDRAAVDAVLAEPRLRAVAAVRGGPWLDVPDPRRSVLDQAVLDAGSALVTLTD